MSRLIALPLPLPLPTEELQLQEDGHRGESLDLPAPNAVRGAGLVNLRQGGDRRGGEDAGFSLLIACWRM